jgi:hypothetical protein
VYALEPSNKIVIHPYINSSLSNMDNTTSMNFLNPVNTLVTGEVVVERNEHISSEFYR